MRKNKIIITIDYETWHPIPEGCEIDWENDLIVNTNALMNICEKNNAKLTLMVEMCEYLWLKENGKTEICTLIEQQLKDAIRRGHDVQLHIHPNWMTELGAKYENGKWIWNWSYASCNDYPYNLNRLFYKCKTELEKIIYDVNPNYKVQAFRAGAYRVQPFNRIAEALIGNNIICDTSVYSGGKSKERGYDFSKCRYANMPYWASKNDPQKCGLIDYDIIELPITVWKRGERWFLDNSEAKVFASRFLQLNFKYFQNNQNYFVLIGHSKGEHDYKHIDKQLGILNKYPNVHFTTITESLVDIKEELQKNEPNYAEHSLVEIQEIMNDIYKSIMPQERNNFEGIEEVLLQGGTLCYGYATLLFNVLKQYGYNVIRVTLVSKDMPNGRGRRKIDSHEVVELTLQGRKYILDATTNRIIPYGIKNVLKNPSLIVDRKNKDSRYIERNYSNYDSSFFYERVLYYKRASAYIYGIENEAIKERLKRLCKNFVFHILPSKIRFYNIKTLLTIKRVSNRYM